MRVVSLVITFVKTFVIIQHHFATVNSTAVTTSNRKNVHDASSFITESFIPERVLPNFSNEEFPLDMLFYHQTTHSYRSRKRLATSFQLKY